MPETLEDDPQEEEKNQYPLPKSGNQNKNTSDRIHSRDNLQGQEPYQIALDELKKQGGEILRNKERVELLLEKVKKDLGEDISSKINLEYDEDKAYFKGTVDILGKKIPLAFVGIKAGDSVSPNFLVYKECLGYGKPTRKMCDEKELLEQAVEEFKKWYTAVESIFKYCKELEGTGIFDIDESQENGELTFKVKEEYKVSIATYGHHGYRSPGKHTIQLNKLIFDIGKAKIGVYKKSDIIYVMYPDKIYDSKNLEKFEEKILKNILNNIEEIKKCNEVEILTNEESDGPKTSV